MKVTFEYDDEELHQARIALDAADVHCAIYQFDQRLRALEKYEGVDLHGLRELYNELFGRYLDQ